jgi:hypothetical protein
MMDNGNSILQDSTSETSYPSSTSSQNQDSQRSQRLVIIGVIVGGLLLLTAAVAAVIYLASPGSPTERIRDIFIIFMALEFVIVGLALVVLIVQLATLINLLQNEIKPILDSTNETANTLRGTAIFLSENLTEPVIKMNQYAVAARKFVELVGLGRKK